MSKKAQQAKIEFIIEMIENIELIISRHKGIVSSLEDFEGVDLGFIENILRNYLPKLKAKILLIKSEL